MWRPLGFILKASNKLFRSEHWDLKTNDRPSNSMATVTRNSDEL
jgi:hypothetical protein